MRPPGKTTRNKALMPPPARPRGAQAVMNARRDPTDALDDYPTPPWATRALTRLVLPELGIDVAGRAVLEPAAGRGIMAAVLRDEGARVFASDVQRYADELGEIDEIASYIGEGLDVLPRGATEALVVTNPPFVLALDFALRAIEDASVAVALLCRSNWAEGVDRHARLFQPRPPTMIAQFVERVPMTEGGYWRDENGDRHPAYRGGYDPDATTATAYAWFIWETGLEKRARWAGGDRDETRFFWIPPGQREALTMADDAARFGKIKLAPPDEPAHLSTIKGRDR